MLELSFSKPVALLEREVIPKYKTYAEAKEAVSKLNISSVSEYRMKFALDPALPFNPDRRYRNLGWQGWEDFLQKKYFREQITYQRAREIILQLGIRTREQYRQRYREHSELHSNPEKFFKGKGWNGWKNFTLAEEIVPYYSYEEAVFTVSSLGIKKRSEYRKMHTLDSRLPHSPEYIYRNDGWVSWRKFLSTSLLTFAEACRLVRSRNCKSRSDYFRLRAASKRLPFFPLKTYKSEWKGWRYFFGLDQKFLSYDAAQSFVRTAGCKSLSEYRKLCRTNPDLPFNPAEVYCDHWFGYPVFFGTKREPFYSWQEASEIVRFEEFDSREEYIAYARTVDLRLPTNAHTVYKQHWRGWSKFLGTDWKKKYTFAECKELIAPYGLASKPAYLDLRAQLRDWRMPKDPRKVYLNQGWQGMEDFLGKPQKPAIYATFREASEAARGMGITSFIEYRVLKRYKEDPRLPRRPDKQYASEWQGWTDFLGISMTRFYTFEQARLVARVHGWRTSKIYKFACSVDQRLPKSPELYYREEGWKGWSDFLGINLHSYETARRLLKEKGVISYKAYFELVRKDSRFPVQPQKWYREHWVNWPTYFSRPVTPRKAQPKQLRLVVPTSARAY